MAQIDGTAFMYEKKSQEHPVKRRTCHISATYTIDEELLIY